MKETNKLIDGYKMEMVATLSRMVSLPAVSPVNGGKGEAKKAEYLKSLLEKWSFRVKVYTYTDSVKVKRPNLVVKYGDCARTIWIVSHMDVVAEGDRGMWNHYPFTAVVKNGKIYGRGTTDNGQSAVASMYALKALKDLGLGLKYNFGLVLVADEELGSTYGIQKLLQEKNLFKKSDMYIVPDAGNSEGDQIEVAEKSALWLKVTIHGKQVHASLPATGVNAFRFMILFLQEVDGFLHKKYSKTDKLFTPNISTFEMTKHEKNVDSTNIIPGKEVFYIDSRILPRYKIDSVLNDIKRISKRKEFARVKFDFEIVQREDAAPMTRPDAEITKLLASTLRKQRGIKPVPIGIGGGTCAAFFRRRGMPSVVWSTCDEVAHIPNEYAKIADMVADAKVFAALFL